MANGRQKSRKINNEMMVTELYRSQSEGAPSFYFISFRNTKFTVSLDLVNTNHSKQKIGTAKQGRMINNRMTLRSQFGPDDK